MKKTIIFDFDGTLVNSLPLITELLLQLAYKKGYKNITKTDIEKYRSKVLTEAFTDYKIPRWKVPYYVYLLLKSFNKQIDRIQLFPGISELISKLLEEGYFVGVLSSNTEENVKTFLYTTSLPVDKLDFLVCGRSIYSKTSKIKKTLKKYELDPANTLYVGDEVKDVKSSHEAGIKVIAVTWGFNTKEFLEKSAPEALADSTEELYSQIKLLFSIT